MSNIEILNDEELFQWKVENLKIHNKDISCIFRKDSNPEIIRDTLKNVKDITNVEIIDIYNGEQIKDHKVSYTFKIEGISKDSIMECENILKGFGAIIR